MIKSEDNIAIILKSLPYNMKKQILSNIAKPYCLLIPKAIGDKKIYISRLTVKKTIEDDQILINAKEAMLELEKQKIN